MFKQLSAGFSEAFKKLSGKSELSEKNIIEALGDVENALIAADVSLDVIKQFCDLVKQKALGHEVIKGLMPDQVFKKIVHENLVKILGDGDNSLTPKTTRPSVLLLCGLQGSGKTTSCAKLARWLKDNKQSVMVVSTDVNRPGAIEQLQVLARDNNIEAILSSVDENPVDIAKRALVLAKKSVCDWLIIDTAGRLHVDNALMDEVSLISKATNPSETIFVMDSMTGQDAVHSAKAFHERLSLTGTILTKVDGDSKGGAALSARLITNAPIKFVGVSEKIADGLQRFDAKRFADQMLDMGDVVGLVETIEKSVDKEKADLLAKKIKKGKFDFNDFAEHIKQMQNMGGMSNVLSKLPGAQQYSEQISAANPDKSLKQILAVIQSMTRQEKANPDLIAGRRKRRIANGSGVDIPMVNKVLKQFKQMQKMMKKFKGKGMQKMLSGFLGSSGPNKI